MKKIIFLLFLLLTSYTVVAKEAEQKLDEIVAIVNEEVITQSELNRALKIAKLELNQEDLSSAQQLKLQKQLLDQIINRRLQLQLANQAGIRVTDDMLDKAIEKVAHENHTSVHQLYKKLSEGGMTAENYRKEMRDQLVLRKLQQQEVVSRITISAQEIDAFLNSKSWQKNASKEYRLQDILIPLSEAPSSQEIITARKRAEVLIDKLNKGENFHKIAQAESSERHAMQGGDLGWRQLAEIPTAFAEQIPHMKAKEITGPIQTPNGFHIIRLTDVRALDSDQGAPSRQQVEDLLLERKFEEAVQNWMSKLRSQAYVLNKLAG